MTPDEQQLINDTEAQSAAPAETQVEEEQIPEYKGKLPKTVIKFIDSMVFIYCRESYATIRDRILKGQTHIEVTDIDNNKIFINILKIEFIEGMNVTREEWSKKIARKG